ncbi:asparagine synthase (glutamine-hydrolyzing) [Planctomycetota bacterium]
MCGIVGALCFEHTAFRVTESYVDRMRETMTHRGPDGSGTWVSGDGRVGLGHRRLAIIDLSQAAGQPMSDTEGKLWIVFNGEIYNHQSIRAELEDLGVNDWSTDHSDTEVILQAYKQWGTACLDRFVGMFAFAIWNAATEELWLVRDRIGIKPLYYSIHHGRITFASEIKALLQDPDQRREVDEESLYHFLSFLTTPAPQTLFSGIQKLPGGTWLKVAQDGRVVQERYWDLWDHVSPLAETSEEDIAERLLEELRRAVAVRKVSDVPVGVFLSGGIDSSTNAALFSEGERQPVKTFCIGYEGEHRTYRNETHYARMMAESIGADFHERLLTSDDMLQFLPDMIRLQDEPIADPVCVPVYYVSALARENGVTVCQVGEGADELFCGYPLWKKFLDAERLNELPAPVWAKKALLGAMHASGMGMTRPYEALRRATRGQPVFWGGAEAFTEAEKRRLLGDRLGSQFRGFTSWEAIRPIRERFCEAAFDQSHLNWMTYLDLRLRLPELLLMRVDKMSMGVSLETRVPFLDHRFVEFAMGIPASLKVKNGTLKHILKKAVRGLIPDTLIDRRKQGFDMPVYDWYSGKLGDRLRHELRDFCRQTDYLDRRYVDRLIRRPAGKKLWYLLNLALWWKEYVRA